MRFQEALQARLRERFRQLYKSDHHSWGTNVKYFLDWARSTPALASLLDSIERAEPSLDPATWRQTDVGHQGVRWPETEVGRAKVVLWMLDRAAANPDDAYMNAHDFSSERNFDAMLRDFNDVAVEPLIDHLEERLAAETDLLYVLERYRRQVLWFDQGRLWSQFEADRAHGEAIYDEDLRRFLFEQGVDFPFSQPEGPSGKPDLLIVDKTDDPIPLEVKLFDGESYGVSHLAKGLGQALRYAEDYGHRDAYLVVFNLTDRTIEISSDEPGSGWPPRFNVEGRTVFVVVVQAAPRPKASAAGKAKVTRVGRVDLIG